MYLEKQKFENTQITSPLFWGETGIKGREMMRKNNIMGGTDRELCERSRKKHNCFIINHPKVI